MNTIGHGSTLNPAGARFEGPLNQLQPEPPPLNLGIRHMEAVKRGTEGEYQYLRLLLDCLRVFDRDPTPKEDRTGTGTYGVFGRQIRFDLEKGFPLLTTKRLYTKAIVAELLWMLSGSTNIQPLQEQDVHIWDEWADENGELGPVYGKQWRRWQTIQGANQWLPEAEQMLSQSGHVLNFVEIDQIQILLDSLRNKPFDRGHVITAWNPAELDQMKLRPCHCLFQFFVSKDRKLSCQLYQRSADIFLGVPFNIASYALLTHLIAREVGLGVGEFVHTFGDLHLYSNHVEQAREQIKREPRPFPTLNLPIRENHVDIFNIKPAAIVFEGYDPHPPIKGDVSI